MKKIFSYEAEKEYYREKPPADAVSCSGLDRYIRCWLDPEEIFCDKAVLDIGAGECAYTRMIPRLASVRSMTACDLLPERMRAAQNSTSGIAFVGGDCYRLPFREQSFDVVFGSLVLHRLPNLPDVVQQIRKVLTHRGLYIGIEPNYLNFVNLYRHYFRRRTNSSKNVYLITPNVLRTAFEDAGFYVGLRCFYAPMPKLKSRFLGTCIGIKARMMDEVAEPAS